MSDMVLVKKVVEGALLVAGRPLSIDQLLHLFGDDDARPARDEVKATLEDLEIECGDKGYELKKVASGFRLQVRDDLAPWISRLWEEKPAKYSRALLETLSIIAYRQPITRGDIEGIRGVAVSSNIVRSLLEREWIRVVGHRDVPGKPALYATTRLFLDYFNLSRLGDLPPLSEIKDLADINPELAFEVEQEQAKLEKEVAESALSENESEEESGNQADTEFDIESKSQAEDGQEAVDELPQSLDAEPTDAETSDPEPRH